MGEAELFLEEASPPSPQEMKPWIQVEIHLLNVEFHQISSTNELFHEHYPASWEGALRFSLFTVPSYPEFFFTLLWFMASNNALATSLSMQGFSATPTSSSVLLCVSALASALPAATSILRDKELKCVKLLVAMAVVR